MREIAIYGRRVIKVTATYDNTKKVAANSPSTRIVQDRGIRDIGTREGMKTMAFEVAEQLAEELVIRRRAFPASS
jgi:threonine synthase